MPTSFLYHVPWWRRHGDAAHFSTTPDLDALYSLCRFQAFGGGDTVFGFTEPSIKQHLRCRRLRLDQGDAVCTVAPAFVMPYMSGWTDEVDKALCLMRFHVPC
jgi:hypothetical protein